MSINSELGAGNLGHEVQIRPVTIENRMNLPISSSARRSIKESFLARRSPHRIEFRLGCGEVADGPLSQ